MPRPAPACYDAPHDIVSIALAAMMAAGLGPVRRSRPLSCRVCDALCVGPVLAAADRRGSSAEVTRVDVARRVDLGASGYEKIVGTIHFAVDPKDPRNRDVVDLDKAPVNASGTRRVLLRPLHPQTQGAARQRRRAGRRPQPRQQGRAERLQSRRLARSRDRKRSRRSLPDALRLHHRVGRLGVRSRGSADDDEDSRAGRHRARQPITGIVRATFTANAKATDVTVDGSVEIRRQSIRTDPTAS